jgi:biopolymer transport protein ExbD
MHSSNDDEMITEINVTPFVDVVLVLLILFMIAAPVVYQQGIRISLPAVINAEKTKSITLSVIISETGEIYVDKDKAPLESISFVVKKALALDPEADVILDADKTLSYEKVLEVVDALKQGGIKNIALGVTKKLM